MAQSCLWQAISSWPDMGLQDPQSLVLENLLLILVLCHQVKDLEAPQDIKGTMITTSEALVPKFTKEQNIAFRHQPLTITFFQEFLFPLKVDRATQIIYPTLPL